MKILLACSAGMSTSLLVNNMKKFADASDVIEARPVRTVPDILDDWDVLLLGPQVRYLEKEYKPLCEQKGKGFGVIPMQMCIRDRSKSAFRVKKKSPNVRDFSLMHWRFFVYLKPSQRASSSGSVMEYSVNIFSAE